MKKIIVSLIRDALNEMNFKEDIDLEKYIEIPPSSEMGDFAFPCFFLASKLKMSPNEISISLRKKIGSKKLTENFQDIQTSGSYINFFINRKQLALKLIYEISKQKNNYGKYQKNSNKTMIEFSQANTHKAFHVGHIRGTSIGESLARVLEFSGDNVIRTNYQGDTGMHVAKWIWCYKKFHSKEKIKKDESWVASIYVDAVKRLAKDKSGKLQKQVDEINFQLGTKEDKNLNSLWKKTRKVSLDSFEKIYKELNTKFDKYFFESQVEERGMQLVDILLKNKIAEISEGAVIINFEKFNLGVWVLLRKDKTVLYSTKDIALAEKKFQEFQINKNIYVVGAAQSLHMQQLFKTLELMKFSNIQNCFHIPFAEVRLPTGKMSSRTGENILYSDFIKEITEHAKKEIKKRFPKISKTELEKRAIKVSISAIKYSMLRQSPNKSLVFDKKEAINFEGDTGPYLLYSYARASSILRKSKKTFDLKKLEFDEDLEEQEIELIKKISLFKEIISKSYLELNPAYLANYSYQLSKIFNEFYHSCPVINSKKQNLRLALVFSFKQILKNSLNLLGIDALEKM